MRTANDFGSGVYGNVRIGFLIRGDLITALIAPMRREDAQIGARRLKCGNTGLNIAFAQTGPSGAIYADLDAQFRFKHLGVVSADPVHADSIQRSFGIENTLLTKIICMIVSERNAINRAFRKNGRVCCRRAEIKQGSGTELGIREPRRRRLFGCTYAAYYNSRRTGVLQDQRVQ